MTNKLIILATTAILASTAAASAGSLSTPLAEPLVLAPVQAERNFELTFGVDHEGRASTRGSYDMFRYNLGSFDSTVRLTAGYAHNDGGPTRQAMVGLEYELSTAMTQNLTGYGLVAVDYVAPATDLSNGDFFATPAVGLEYQLSSALSAFTEVGYSWDLSNSTARVGGYAEVGVEYAVTDNFALRPAVSRTFDTGADQTIGRLEAVIRF